MAGGFHSTHAGADHQTLSPTRSPPWHRPPPSELWTDVPLGATTVTFDSFDGTNIAGSFEAVVPSLTNPERSAKTVVGTFRGPAERADPNR